MNRLHVVNGKPRHLGGWRRQRDDRRDLLVPPPDSAIALPPKWDLRPSLPLRVEDQDTVGCCTGEGVTTALEVTLHKEGLDAQLSPLWLYARSRQYEGTPLAEDSGCEIRDVVRVAASAGCALESSWPFDPAAFAVDPGPVLDAEAFAHRALFYYNAATDRATKASLIQGFPVVVGFDVPNHMMGPEVARTGLVHHMVDSEGYAGGHCVVVVGYDDALEAGPDHGAYLCMNSWGTEWAMDGFFWLSFACRPRDRWTIRRAALP